ncbi:MAG TPA: heme ABC transporter permease [Sphingomonadales bacterium]|nr:heme ABC transporter permease [Sphingomonadales bacterium]
MHAILEPKRFQHLAAAALPWLSGLTLVAFGMGLYFALLASPPDYQQGETVRIMYVHVPSAWMSMMAYGAMALFSALYLVWKHPTAALAAKALAPIGLVFTGLALVTGSIWGKPTWGAWWVWDARLTSVLVMFFIYLGYVALWRALGDGLSAAKASSILALVGVINLPIIKFSVEWWTTLHQGPSVLRLEGPAIDPSMLRPLLVMAGASFLYMAAVFVARFDAELKAARVEKLLRERAKGG